MIHIDYGLDDLPFITSRTISKSISHKWRRKILLLNMGKIQTFVFQLFISFSLSLNRWISIKWALSVLDLFYNKTLYVIYNFNGNLSPFVFSVGSNIVVMMLTYDTSKEMIWQRSCTIVQNIDIPFEGEYFG